MGYRLSELAWLCALMVVTGFNFRASFQKSSLASFRQYGLVLGKFVYIAFRLYRIGLCIDHFYLEKPSQQKAIRSHPLQPTADDPRPASHSLRPASHRP